jgi:hypothetical protein
LQILIYLTNIHHSLAAQQKSDINEDNIEDEDVVATESNLNLKALAEIIKLHRALLDKAKDYNPVMDMSLKFKREIETASVPYLEIHRESQKTATNPSVLVSVKPLHSMEDSEWFLKHVCFHFEDFTVICLL